LHLIDFHHLIPQVVDHLHSDAARSGLCKRNERVPVERFPVFKVYLSLERCLEALVGIVLAKEVGLAHEEAIAVVIAIDEPAGNVVGLVTADFAGGGIKEILELDLYRFRPQIT
jgi:hypothetical protein